MEPQVLVPEIDVRFRPETARLSGLSPGELRRATAMLVRGTKVGEVLRGEQVIDVIVVGTPTLRSDLEALRELRIAAPIGGEVALNTVAEVAVPALYLRFGARSQTSASMKDKRDDLLALAPGSARLTRLTLPGEAATDAYDVSACVTSATPELPTALANGAMVLDALRSHVAKWRAGK